jgi:hypothetical protein
MAYRPSPSSIVPDSYLVMVKKPRGKSGLSAEFDLAAATQKMVGQIRRLAKKHGETVEIETKNLLGAGFCKLRCDRHFAELVQELSSVGHVAQERVVQPGHKGPKFNV